MLSHSCDAISRCSCICRNDGRHRGFVDLRAQTNMPRLYESGLQASLATGWLACSAGATDTLAEQHVNKYGSMKEKGSGYTVYNRWHVNSAGHEWHASSWAVLTGIKLGWVTRQLCWAHVAASCWVSCMGIGRGHVVGVTRKQTSPFCTEFAVCNICSVQMSGITAESHLICTLMLYIQAASCSFAFQLSSYDNISRKPCKSHRWTPTYMNQYSYITGISLVKNNTQ